MNYLAKLKDKIGKGQDEVAEADRFEPFDTTHATHYPGSNMQPMVVNESKIANRWINIKRFKSTWRGGEPHDSKDSASLAAPGSNSTQAVAVSELNAALEVFRQTRPYGTTRLRHDQACWAAKMFLNEWEGLVVVQFD